MVAGQRLICSAEQLCEGGAGVRFTIDGVAGPLPAFVVRFDGQPRAFVNQCAHVPITLDWLEGVFFDGEGHYLICATHGATYDPVSGICVAGPCRGARLRPVPVVERDGAIWLAPTEG
ncbi:Rieske (2Fe-2S) protein [Denitromonas iodatirespirans]|uniref:Rieske 2Fe-2S domain-containing protein n=1 Tax=Denitromonas iodatirespirans TaxID=2795389 RepID=A0A944HCP8_DENI1|nr:Rieske 2Fe-2S domain-containing protein [Denitromonas iodatirespirans]MBT0961376.1 Rieske 2Fe-2S domain-containing protein [Denitromonas iodatirespirans]